MENHEMLISALMVWIVGLVTAFFVSKETEDMLMGTAIGLIAAAAAVLLFFVAVPFPYGLVAVAMVGVMAYVGYLGEQWGKSK